MHLPGLPKMCPKQLLLAIHDLEALVWEQLSNQPGQVRLL